MRDAVQSDANEIRRGPAGLWVRGMLVQVACGLMLVAGCTGTVEQGAGGGPDGGAGGVADAAPEAPDAGGPDLSAAPRLVEWRGAGLGQLALSDGAVMDGDAVTIQAGGGAAGTDTAGMYNGGDYRVATAEGPVVQVALPLSQAVVSWNAETPAGSWIEVLVAARHGDTWTADYDMGVWAASDEVVARHSVNGQGDGDGTVDTDTLVLDQPADAYRVTVRLFTTSGGPAPRLFGLSVAATPAAAPAEDLPPLTDAWGTAVDVPTRSQMIYPDGGEVWCSPTSTSMVLAYWAGQLGRPDMVETVPDAAHSTYDAVYGGTGNWPFNTAHAAAVGQGAIAAEVTRLDRIEQIERLTAAGFPVVTSVSFGPGELSGAPIPSTAGHLLVVRGFDESGQVLVNDPAGPDNGHVRFTYDRAEFDAAWAHSHRTVYLIHPADMPLPDSGALGEW